MAEQKMGRPPGPMMIVPCSAGAECRNALDGEPALVEKYPSAYKASSTKRFFCDEVCRVIGGARLPTPLSGVCQDPGHVGDKHFTYTRSSRYRTYCSEECYHESRSLGTETVPCGWCGGPITDRVSRNRHYHTAVAPEPECGWPPGVTMTCREFGHYKHIAQPMRFVNGKPVRMWLDRRDDPPIERPQIWLPEKNAWEFEHRWVWSQAHGTIPYKMHVHHRDLDKMNNALSNLEMLTPRQHSELHDALQHAEVARLRSLLIAANIDPNRQIGAA